MKKLSFFVFAVLFFSVSGIPAQGFHLGIKAGTNISDLTGRSFNSRNLMRILWPVHLQKLISPVNGESSLKSCSARSVSNSQQF